jgi:nitroreductase
MNTAIRAFLEPFIAKMPESEAARLRGYIHYYTFFDQAPVVIAILGLAYASKTTALLSQYGQAPEAKVVDAGQQSIGACIQNLLLAAHALGYGTCWMTGPMVAQQQLEDLLRVADPWHLMALIPVGRPAVHPPAPARPDLDQIITVIETKTTS